MNSQQKSEALTLSQKIMEDWYTGDDSLVCSYLDESVIWIGSTEKQFYIGKPSVRNALKCASKEIIPCTLSQQSYVIGGSSVDTCLCVGRYVATLDTDTMFISEPQRATFLWQMINGELRITHIHISNVAAVVAPDEEFPLAASRRNYEYGKKKLSEQEELIRINTTDYAFHLLSKSAIVFLEAQNANIIIHYAGDESFKVHTPLQKFMQEHCPDFIRIHRTYAINPYHVRMIKGLKITMDTGRILPVSQTSFQKIYEQINGLF